MHRANARRTAWLIQLQRILRFQKQHFAPQHATLRVQRPTKDDLSVRSPGYVALAKLAPLAVGRNSILALGYKPSGLVNGPINSSVMLAAKMRVLATKTTVPGYDQIRDGSLTSLRLIKGLGTEHQLLQGRTQPQPVRGAQLPKPAGDEAGGFLDETYEGKPRNLLTLPRSMDEMANSSTATPRRSPVSSIPFLRAVGDAWASRLPSARSSFTNVGNDRSLRARPPPKEEQFDLDGFANKASHIGQEGQQGASGYQPQQRKASPSATTIHIDGSVLGRWAIQHLEQTLGKPATGMTGVDPRANPPRSRVSPF
jgi:hypothetical protein